MNIHEHQAKKILKDYGAQFQMVLQFYHQIKLKTKSQIEWQRICSKAQIHAGGRGKAGGVKLVKNIKDLENEAKK